ncbi:MAG: Ig-like domain-containing protein, partial [Bacteroidales bacterium]|nr:Ig-like domain-containing protein [Bacteroidales bacterium]
KVNLTTQPTNVNDVCPNSMVNFTIVAENADTYQWQTSTDNGLNWSDLSNDNTYSGTKSNTLGVKASTNLANNEFRCIAGNEYRGNEISETVHFNFESGKPVISSTHNDQILNADNEISLPNYKSSVVASDNCDASLTITQQPAPGNMISGATNEVTLTATDDAGNYSIVKFNVAVEDKTKPKVTLSTPKNLVNKSFVVTFAFSEAIVGLLGNDIITVNNGVVNNLSPVNNKTFTAEIAPTQTGKVFVSLKADKLKDENGNFNNASEVLIVNADMEGPAIKLSTVSSLVNAAFSVKIQFSEKVSNFEEDHITVTNGYVETGSLDSESDSIYTCVIVPTVIGTVSLHIGKEKVKDMVGNLNPKASSPLNVGFDPSSLNELSAYTGIEIRPNPANSFIEIHIKEHTGLFTYAILDITGSMVKKNILNNKEKISINELPAGLYLLNIETDNMVISKRLVIQR